MQKVAGESSCCHTVNMQFFYESSQGSTLDLSELAGEKIPGPCPLMTALHVHEKYFRQTMKSKCYVAICMLS